MSIKLPVMRMLCYRWMLPQTVAEQCDYYFLDRPSFPDFADSLQMINSRLHINRHGVDFEVVFQNGAEVTYSDCIKKELAGESSVQVTFWCSFRSLSFEWAGVTHTRSVVLVQPAREKVRSREPREKLLAHAVRYDMGTKRFAEKLNITEEKAMEMYKEYQTYLESLTPAEFPAMYMQEPTPKPLYTSAKRPELNQIGTTFADRVANSLDRMEDEE